MAQDPSQPGIAPHAQEPILSLRGISKSYPGVKALADVNLDIHPGRGHALVGENGAGKSTLIKVIAGLVRPDAGEVLIDGQPVVLRTPSDALRHGIHLVPQEISLAEDRNIAENIFLGKLPHAGPFVQQRNLLTRSEALLARLGLEHIDPRSLLRDLRPAVKQMVMIARGISTGGRMFILDEPTATLTEPEVERLIAVVQQLEAEGSAVLYVSHRLPELQHVADSITVMRDGRSVARMPLAGTTEDDLVQAMVGRSVERFFDTQQERVIGEKVLEVEGLSRKGSFQDISLSLRAGEIVGLAGLVGAGRTEVARSLFGLDKADKGTVRIDGKEVKIRRPKDAIKAGLALVPEERKSQALVLNFPISHNIVLPHLKKMSTMSWLSRRRIRALCESVAEQVNIKAPSVATSVGSLSGGNQQKVVLGRWFCSDPRVYILDEPTRGIDVGAKAEIYQNIGRFTAKGAAALVISSELPELLGICDRVLVMRSGRLVGEISTAEASEQNILQLAIGATK
ncbi:sugar ABC transporter ATP-binding protein [Arthrobacter sp. SLBN-112]|uniref:sugar ABC transporter ATP-binding protein n=1 Tax=Arthrobacter sp. SLBN-112 TaxID=2768452 RepID=UPI0027B0883E|nr:sugar ABC transporter ATP-binding protein [Arthrobacter sp. SLBN-112]MDQ0799026.1 rhamnose transport system ATP-binding protein [Arthrobacter sp. SLBN-112]